MKATNKNLILTIVFIMIFIILGIMLQCTRVDVYTIDRGDYIETITSANGKVRIDTSNGIITVDNIVVSRFTTEKIRVNGDVIVNQTL